MGERDCEDLRLLRVRTPVGPKARERLLALCYDLRHAYMGDRNVRMQENGMDRERAE